MEIRYAPDGKSVAIKTGPGVTVGDWFVFHEDAGGSYADEALVDEWPNNPDLTQPNQKKEAK